MLIYEFNLQITQGGLGVAKLNSDNAFECSNWPTIPQVYVNGEFVGGSDILIAMHRVWLRLF